MRHKHCYVIYGEPNAFRWVLPCRFFYRLSAAKEYCKDVGCEFVYCQYTYLKPQAKRGQLRIFQTKNTRQQKRELIFGAYRVMAYTRAHIEFGGF